MNHELAEQIRTYKEAWNAAHEMYQPRPIESAPRDGTRIMLFLEKANQWSTGTYEHPWWLLDTSMAMYDDEDFDGWLPMPPAPKGDES